MAQLIQRHNPFRSNGYQNVGTFAVEDEDDNIQGQNEDSSLLSEPIEKITFMLRRGGEMGGGFGFVAAKESIVELKLQGWQGTHLMELLSFADGGLYIGSVNDDSPAKEAGVMRFDVIQKVNGQDVRTWTAAETITLIKSTEDVLVLEVVRHRDTPMREAQIQWDHVKDPLHKVRTGLMKAFNIQPPQ